MSSKIEISKKCEWCGNVLLLENHQHPIVLTVAQILLIKKRLYSSDQMHLKCCKLTFSPYKDENGYYPQVFIEAEIPDEMLLQSNFILWEGCCMNGFEICDTLNKKIELFDVAHDIIERGFRAYPDELNSAL